MLAYKGKNQDEIPLDGTVRACCLQLATWGNQDVLDLPPDKVQDHRKNGEKWLIEGIKGTHSTNLNKYW